MTDNSKFLFTCELCWSAVFDDEVGFDGENCRCRDCVEYWTKDQVAYWKPLYDAEVAAGIHNPKGGNDA